MNSKPFGKLSFSSHSFETEAEIRVIALQAALKVHGMADDSKILKSLNRLKKSMSKNKVHKYTFNIINNATQDTERESSVKELQADRRSEEVVHSLSGTFGVTFHHVSLLTTSSKYLVLTCKCVGPEGTLGTSQCTSALQAAYVSLQAKGFDPTSRVSILKRTSFKDRKAVGLLVQCVYWAPPYGI